MVEVWLAFKRWFATSVGLSQSSVLSSLAELLRAQTTALVTASLTLITSSTFCQEQTGKSERVPLMSGWLHGMFGMLQTCYIVLTLEGKMEEGPTLWINGSLVVRSFSCGTHTVLDTHTHQNDRKSFTARPVHYSKLRGDFILEPHELLGSTWAGALQGGTFV